MISWDLPITVEIDGTEHKIRNKCDYRIILDVISVLNDDSLDEESKIKCSLYIFYEDLSNISDFQTAINEMMKIINLGEENQSDEPKKQKIMDWEHDYNNITPPISRVLGYSVRNKDNYTHWYDFIGAYMEIGDCYFAQIVSIRSKIQKGKKLDEQDKQFYREHKKEIDLPINLTEDDKQWLDGDW